MFDLVLAGLRTLNELLTAGIAITAFSMLLYVLSFNLNDRVTRSFAIVLISVSIVFVSETLASVSSNPELMFFFLQLQWVGIIILPSAYLHLSDALLETTGRPSRGRRRNLVYLAYVLSGLFLVALFAGWLVGPVLSEGSPAPHFARMPLTWVFSLCYVVAMAFSGLNFWRAYLRTVTKTSRRRMAYFMVGALAPALGSYPFLLFGAGVANQYPLLFWSVVVISNAAVSVMLVLMAYSIAFFGVSWPDRVIKRRLAKWLMRGPVTASVVLALTTIIRRVGLQFGAEYNALIPFVMVASILILEHLITLSAPVWERLLFRGVEGSDVRLLQTLEERTLTTTDLQQFLESLLAAICDRLQVNHAFAASFTTEGLDLFVSIGGENRLDLETMSADLVEVVAENNLKDEWFSWGEYRLMPLFDREDNQVNLLGLLGFLQGTHQSFDEEQESALAILSQRASLAFSDRYRALQAFNSLQALTPQIDMIQQLRAAARFDSAEVLKAPGPESLVLEDGRLTKWVKDALTHYWGGPKLTGNPLMSFKVVERAAETIEDNQTNALRAVLRQAIEQTRPEGERRFTAEWIIYNILEMKFMEGHKVREIATRLAISEADLYRKQRVAIETVAKVIYDMEQQAREG
jgi:hypothetical protein